MITTILPDRQAVGRVAAHDIGDALRRALAGQDRARVVFAAAPSQSETLAELVRQDGIDWGRVDAFHMDEYIGLPPDHPARFANWLDQHLFTLVPFGTISRITPGADPQATCDDYGSRLRAESIDLVVCGIGETGHIAFNDPPVADFSDPADVKIVRLDSLTRQQQVDEGCFASLDEVPTDALTVTIPPLMSAAAIVCIVPGAHKRAAVTATLTGPVSTACPASILTTHPNVHFYLDKEAGADVQPTGDVVPG
jgi:glucosamine-6-phosphate deaminase